MRLNPIHTLGLLVALALAAAFLFLISAGPIPAHSSVAPAMTTNTATTYYVDCAAGDDTRTGQSLTDAWRSLAQATAADLLPGDTLRFKRGCAWTGPLHLGWHGNAAQFITVGAYGTGPYPVIQDTPFGANVRISGSYLRVENLHATQSMPPNPDPTCNNQPVAWRIGFAFISGASYNTLANSQATQNAIGIYFTTASHHNHAERNTITGNNAIWEIDSDGYAQGAMGILLHGDSQTIAHNYFAGNRALCAYKGDAESNSIELYQATNSLIHHNISYDRTFSELGSSPKIHAANNTYAYNLHVASDYGSNQGARFIITRGWGHRFGPVLNTIVLHNTVYLTGKNAKGVSCHFCSPEILTLTDNILWADPEPVSNDNPFTEANNIYWSTNWTQFLHWYAFSMSPTSRIANPQFVDPAQLDFNLRADSPARDAAGLELLPAALHYDLARTPVPIGPRADIGAFEYTLDPWLLPIAIPGRIEAENYRPGGEGVGYHDTTPGNAGGAYRAGDVDIQGSRDTDGGYNVGWIAAGEWLAYDINLPASAASADGLYRLVARVAAETGPSRFHIEIDGVDATGSLTINATGAWQTWTDLSAPISLTPGSHTLRFVAETGGFNLNYLTIDTP